MKKTLELFLEWCILYRQSFFGVWLSLVERFVRDEEVVGSNPVTPTVSVCQHLTVGNKNPLGKRVFVCLLML